MARSKNFVSVLLSQKPIKLGIVAVIAIAVVGFGVKALSGKSNQEDKQLAGVSLGANDNTKESVKIDLNQTIDIPVDSTQQDITYTIVDAEIKDTIVLKGTNARAVDGKQFLILNLKLSNRSEQRVRLNTRDYVRLGVNGQEERLAPSIHNDPVEVQPISDQYTRLGFSVNKSDTDYVLYLGEISEEKIEIPVQL